MTCRHHPHEDLLLGYASGTLDEATSLVIATHLTTCPRCRADVAVAEAVGGALLDEIAPAEIKCFAAIMNRLGEARFIASQAYKNTGYPRTLDAYIPSAPIKWRRIGPGLRYASLLAEGHTRAGLLCCAPGADVTLHTHDGEELTVVLAGAYNDGSEHFHCGDVQYADHTVLHRPVANREEGCTVLVVNKGRVRPTSFWARLFMRFISI